jgi:ABC-2 type transport system ATP-binding protein
MLDLKPLGWHSNRSNEQVYVDINVLSQEDSVDILKVNRLSKYYGNHAAVRNVSFQIKQGEIVGLLGLNGAGKSTILKILGTFLAPSAGDVEIGGLTLGQSVEKIRGIIGYLPDRPPLYDEMTVVSYLKYVAALKNIPSVDIDKRVKSALVKTNLTEVAWTPLGELSHGFRQRAGIAQAIIHEPKIIILDEPINGLDPVQIVEMRDLIVSLRKTHTVILSSHILSEITKTCDRILIMDRGALVAEGAASDLEKRLSGGMRILAECKNNVDANSLRNISGVRNADVALAKESGLYSIKVDCDGDLRSQVAFLLVSSGAELVSLQRDDKGLESVFMSLVKSDAQAREGRSV